MIAVVDYATGNLRSVADALRRAGAEFTLTADPALLRGADKVILPGVGEASSAMSQLRERGLDTVIPSLTQPVLGICIGMQLMCLSSEVRAAMRSSTARLRGSEAFAPSRSTMCRRRMPASSKRNAASSGSR